MGDDSSDQLTVAPTTPVPPPKQRSNRLLLVATPGGGPSDPLSLSPSSPTDQGQRTTRKEGVVGTGRRPSSLGRVVSSQSLKNTWKLKYHDFLPGEGGRALAPAGGAMLPERTESFQHVVEKANDWLSKNPEMQIKTCETVTWMSHDATRLCDPEVMLLSQNISDDSQTYFVRGLRLWLVPSTSSSSSSSLQRIGFIDVSPSRSDDIQGLVAKVNKKLVHNQVKGELVKVETLGVPLMGKANNPKTRLTRWRENSNDNKDYAFIIRVFQLIGSKASEKNKKKKRNRRQLGVKDFVPMPTDDGYEGYETLTDRCSNWMRSQPDARLINLQSVMIRKTDGPHEDISRSCHYTIPGVTSPDPIEVFRILRVIFARTVPDGPPVPSWGPETTIACPFTFETFTPELIRQREAEDGWQQPPREKMERMKEMYAKVMAFLRTTGADVVGVETVMNPTQDVVTTDVNGRLSEDAQVHFIFKIRIFLTAQPMISDSLPIVRTVKRSSINPLTDVGGSGGGGGGAQEESGGVGGGSRARNAPLFLGSVVSRRYKYRWLILSLFGFTCMAIIVVVSVVYSNK